MKRVFYRQNYLVGFCPFIANFLVEFSEYIHEILKNHLTEVWQNLKKSLAKFQTKDPFSMVQTDYLSDPSHLKKSHLNYDETP